MNVLRSRHFLRVTACLALNKALSASAPSAKPTAGERWNHDAPTRSMPCLSVLFADVLALPSIETGTGRLPPIVVQTIPARLPVSYICEYLYSSRSKINRACRTPFPVILDC